MNITLVVSAVFVAALIGSIIANFLIRKKSSNQNLDEEVLEDRIARLSNAALQNNTDQFLKLANEVLGSQKTDIKNEIRTDLEGKKTAIANLIDEIRKDIRKNEERLAKSDDERVKSFSTLKTELENYKEITGDLKVSTEKLKEMLSNNQMRGAFGEQVAENLLKMAGFVIGQDYEINMSQSAENTRPDFTLYLPDKTKINIDAKFPYASLVKYSEAKEKTEQEMYMKKFRADVKEKIKQVCTREYINPQEKTVDFVILFIPNEMIFSFIYDKMNDIWEDAMHKKVILAGPFSFTAILRMVKQAYTNFRYQENLQNIIGLIQRFDIEYQKYSDEINKLGERITSVGRQYEIVATTRNRKLTTIIDKIKNQEVIEDKSKELESIE